MIDTKLISHALQDHLLAMADCPPARFDNKSRALTRPYLDTEMVRVSTTDRTVRGQAWRQTGYMMVTLVYDLDKFANESEDMGSAISRHFQYPLTFRVTGGKISITKPVHILQGFRDSPDWRIPVRIDYQAIEQE